MEESALNVVSQIRLRIGEVIRGKPEVIDQLLVGVLSAGHVLLEDVPGVGKTTLAKALARAFEVDFTRVQFTPDLLPADILGAQVLDPRDGTFTFRAGPLFTHVLLADEINRASPRTQSALLEAMNEGQATIDGVTHRLPRPFFVLATQNPADYQGTYPLPEAQLDRFLMRLSIGYPAPDDELAMLFARQHGDPLDEVSPVATAATLLELQALVRNVTVKQNVAGYLLRVVDATRKHGDLEVGVSPRGGLALFRASQARAMLRGRAYVSPEDIQALAESVLAHRVMLTPQARYGGQSATGIVADIVSRVPVPT
ncbi:MAG: magnesium chelatase [Deltaproteobacteria bacterium HGW-Deltaproteobacteria-20]|nr:MAG: magnesium chelatase [Deltaproteobacteria bacterium HGW-Deltaproteobacteria-20]